MKVIVNADDFGANREVNQAICQCFRKGICTNTTLMVNMPYTDEAVACSKECSFFDKVGLHINLAEGKPLTEKIRFSELFCDKEGYFNQRLYSSNKTRLYFSKSDYTLARAEIEAQIVRYLEYGMSLVHIDSHYHVHTNLPICRILSSLVSVYGIKSIRLSRNMYHNLAKSYVIYKKYINHRIKTMNVKTVDYFGSFDDYKIFSHKIKYDDVVEIMVHPILDNKGNLLATEKPMEQIEQLLVGSVELISYKNL